jgi:hypothetical protein
MPFVSIGIIVSGVVAYSSARMAIYRGRGIDKDFCFAPYTEETR